MKSLQTLLNPAWYQALELDKKPYAAQLEFALTQLYASGQPPVYPKQADVFNGLNLTLPHQVQVMILGQDPYHGPNQAHGLAFSVLPPTPPPPSLVNIFKELQNSVTLPHPPKNGDLTHWAQQGILLLNSTLTVEAGKPNSHKALGWQALTDDVIRVLNAQTRPIVFVLWGNFARKKKELINTKTHLVLEAPHPSPLSAHQGFFGCRHFEILDGILQLRLKQPMRWIL